MYDIKDLFVEFLLENDCYSQAQNNFLEEMKVTVEEWAENYTGDPREILNNGFWWNRTPEGYHYWDNIDELWRILLE